MDGSVKFLDKVIIRTLGGFFFGFFLQDVNLRVRIQTKPSCGKPQSIFVLIPESSRKKLFFFKFKVLALVLDDKESFIPGSFNWGCFKSKLPESFTTSKSKICSHLTHTQYQKKNYNKQAPFPLFRSLFTLLQRCMGFLLVTFWQKLSSRKSLQVSAVPHIRQAAIFLL